MEKTNQQFENSILFTDPITDEELRPFCEPENTEGGEFIIYVENKDGSRKWKHTIKTEEI